MSDFDKHSHVVYLDLTHLFWGHFPYKVTLPDLGPAYDALVEDYVELPDDDVTYRMTTTTSGANFFFIDAADAKEFIETNLDLVQTVTRPRSIEEIEMMRDRKIRVRKNLFWHQYRWCMTFKTNVWRDGESAAREIDEWITTYFADDEARVRHLYSYSTDRKLYVATENDALAVKIGLGDLVKTMECCVLQSEIETKTG